MPKGVYERTPEMCAAMSKGQKGVPKSPRTPEHCRLLSERVITDEWRTNLSISRRARPPSNILSEAAKVHYDIMRGGNDIVGHHVAYDLLRPKELRVWVTRKFHGSIHNPKGTRFGTYGYSLID